MKDCKKASDSQYRNKVVWNQRAGALSFVNTTGSEQVRIDNYIGSNIALTNVANVENAANNKQTNVTNDQYSTVKNNNHVYIGGDHRENRIGDSYTLVGIKSKEQVEALKNWQESYRELAKNNSLFMIQRGGQSYPNGKATPFDSTVLMGNPNPTVNQARSVINNDFNPDELQTEEVKANFKNIEFSPTNGPSASNPIPTIDIATGAGAAGTNTQPGDNLNGFYSAATEGIMYPPTIGYLNLEEDIKNTQDQRTKIEQQLGTGGKVSTTIFRDKQEVVGAAFNDYPSVRIDWKGRAQPVEVAVGRQTTFTTVGSVPHVEEVANDSVFPVGNYTIQAGNKFNVTVGSGGVQIKTGGAVDISGTTVKVSGHKINVQSKAGVNIASDEIIELQSPKNISLRSNKQIYIEPGLGVSNNIVVGGGSYTEGEVFVNHITAPVEIQQTEDVTLYGKFNTKKHHSLAIGEVNVAGSWRTVYAMPADNLIKNYDHAHNFKNVPLRLTQSNADMREIAQKEGINVPGYSTSAHSQSHERGGITKAEDVTGVQPSKVEPGVILPESPQIGVDKDDVINSAGQFIQKPPPVPGVEGIRGLAGMQGRGLGRLAKKVLTSDLFQPGSKTKVDKQKHYNYVKKSITNSSLNGYVPADGAKFGIKEGTPDEWANYFTKLATLESSYNTNTVGDIGKFPGNSNGLYQLSPNDATNYKFLDRPYTQAELIDPAYNTNQAIRIHERLVQGDGVIAARGRGAARYWSPLRSGGTWYR